MKVYFFEKVRQAWKIDPSPDDPNLWDMLKISQAKGEKIELWWTRFIIFSICGIIVFFLLKLFNVTLADIMDLLEVLEVMAIGLIIYYLYRRKL